MIVWQHHLVLHGLQGLKEIIDERPLFSSDNVVLGLGSDCQALAGISFSSDLK